MLKIKSLTLLYKNFIIILLFLCINGCSFHYLYNKSDISQMKEIYVDNIPEVSGMYMRQSLKDFFPSNNINNAKYILRIINSINNNYILNNIYGFATQNQITFTSNWFLIDKKKNKIIISNTISYNTAVDINSSSYSTKNNNDIALKLASEIIAKNIAIKIISILRQNPNLDK